jgi:hypothetical protein
LRIAITTSVFDEPRMDAILTLVNMTLGRDGICPDGIAPGVTPDVSLILQAVDHALNGCA